MNKASGGDGLPVELFQILKDDAVKVLHSVCQQIWKTQQWPRDWNRSVFIPVLKKAMPKNAQTTTQTVENSERDVNTRPPDLPLEKPVCRSEDNS